MQKQTDQQNLEKLIAKNEFGTYMGISQKQFDIVWNRLTNPNGNSVLYISMEIGADPDVYNPLRSHLSLYSGAAITDPDIHSQLEKQLTGPGKIPTYSGGLGVLAGDTLKSFAEFKIPVAAISLLYRHGFFTQIVDSRLGQIDKIEDWKPEDTPGLYLLKDPKDNSRPLTIEVPFYNEYDQETLALAHVWMKLEFNHSLDYFIPEFLLDFSLPETAPVIRNSVMQLYNSESNIVKAIQRRMLGIGIIPVMQQLGITSRTFHLNEQHGVVLAMQLISEEIQNNNHSTGLKHGTNNQIEEAAKKIADHIVYTIHTPVKAGHDRFDKSLYAGISQKTCQHVLNLLASDEDEPHTYNFTNLAMRVNRSTNSVSRLHRDVTRKQFPQFSDKISAITNGVHHLTWISDARGLFFDTIPELEGWRDDPGVFSKLDTLISDKQFRQSFWDVWHQDTVTLYDYLNDMLVAHRNRMTSTWIDPPNYFSSLIDHDTKLEPDTFTIGFARRFSTYKRADLIFYDIDKLCEILTATNQKINFIFAGKAHPADEPGKTVIKSILDHQERLYDKSDGRINLIFIPNYNMKIAKMLVSGVHAWLNTPKRPLEASGTSGMKAAMNGVPNISSLDGWWVEGYHNGETGWKFGHEGTVETACLDESRETLLYEEDSLSFYQLLPDILESFYHKNDQWEFLDKSIQNLIINVPIFNTHRMTAEYLDRYRLKLNVTQKKKMTHFSQLYSSDI